MYHSNCYLTGIEFIDDETTIEKLPGYAWKLKDPSDESPSLFNIIRMHLVTICAYNTYRNTHTHITQNAQEGVCFKLFGEFQIEKFKRAYEMIEKKCRWSFWMGWIHTIVEFRCATLTKNAIFCINGTKIPFTIMYTFIDICDTYTQILRSML